MKGWKQPIPTNLEAEFGDDKQTYLLFVLLILKSCNSNTKSELGNKFIPIKRGQTVFGRNSWCKYLNRSPSGTEKILKRLEKTGKVTCNRTRSCTIVTITNYDELTSMSQEKEQVSNKLVTSKEQVSNTSKSVKSVKSERKKEKKEPRFFTKTEIKDFFERGVTPNDY